MTEYAEMAGLTLVVPPDDFDPLESQRELQGIIHDKKREEGKSGITDHSLAAMNVGELLDRIRFNHEALCAEHQEMLEFLPWKEWKTYDVDRNAHVMALGDIHTELKFEAVDKLHFILNDFINLDMDWAEVMTIFATKQQENRDRQARGY